MKSVLCVLVVERDLEGGFRIAGAGCFCLQLLLRGARLVRVNILLVVVGGQHGCKMMLGWPPSRRFCSKLGDLW